MKNRVLLSICCLAIFLSVSAQTDHTSNVNVIADQLDSIKTATDSLADNLNDSINNVFLNVYKERFTEMERLRVSDSIARAQLEGELNSLKTTDNLKKEDLQKQLDELQAKETERLEQKKSQITSLRSLAKGYPVIGPGENDTIFFIYSGVGSFTARDRAENITQKIDRVFDDENFNPDSIIVVKSDELANIVYKDITIIAVSETDALWHEKDRDEMAEEYSGKIKKSLIKAKEENSLLKILMRIGLVILVLAGSFLVLWGINKLYHWLVKRITARSDKFLKDLSYKNYTFFSKQQELKVLLFLLKIFRWVFIIIAIYLILPVLFSIFPVTRGWADYLFNLIWSPVRKMLLSFWKYLPNVFTILVIYFVMKYIIRFIKYIFTEIQLEKLKISGFDSDWAIPTFQIVRVVLVAFGFIMIFPYLPFSDSPIFAGVSVFLGLLVSLGSSSAISNIIAGLVITYMRPFHIGDRIKLGDTTGDVIEKTILVTRLRTTKNEEITIPNSVVLAANTVNYSTFSKNEGLIIHTNITMGYDYAWQDIYAALIEAALRTDSILKNPQPFVLQASLDDFYVSYQLNAYTSEANKQAKVYSDLHQNIQDVFNEKGFELLSPHYRAERDGNAATFPQQYLPKDYQNPGFKVKVEYEEDNKEEKK